MRPLVWFRRDLRTLDHTALYEASRAATKGIVAAFILCKEEWNAHNDAPVKIDFWLRNLRSLSGSLERLNIPLVVADAPSRRDIAAQLLAIAQRARCDALYYNHEYEVNEQARDAAVVRHFQKAGLASRSFHDHVVFDPATIRTGEGRFYTVYTPFKKAFIKRFEHETPPLQPAPQKQPAIDVAPVAPPAAAKGFESSIDPALWPEGEDAARKRLRWFAERAIESYKDRRDTPSIDATSRLSPYLNAGVLSPRQCIAAAREANAGALDDRMPGAPGPAHWISEVIWREFYQHILVGFPRVSMNRAFKAATERIVWNDNQEHFERWKNARTGVPIVDAAITQLRATGWMHNRLRMIVAMYLTKDLFLDWRLGEQFFMQHLIDGDLGSNNGGWQWSASTGTDAAPYFRIFNSITQSERCDPDGAFIRHWLPELRDVEGDAIHDPQRLPALLRARINYPPPLVDRESVRDRVMQAFQAISTTNPA